METNQVILVNEKDEMLGVMDKTTAHQQGKLHRAFSVFIFDNSGRMLLQQRALDKYHSAGLWSNACCSHPRPGEELTQAVKRRLQEELGFETAIEGLFSFIYKATVGNGLTEFEFDHVFVGEYSGAVLHNTLEVSQTRFEKMDMISEELQNNPQHYTEWFRLAFPRMESWYKQRYTVIAGEQGK